MSSTTQSPNWREILSARSTITGKQEYLSSTSGALLITGSGLSGSVAITSPIGQTTKSASVSVTLASDQGILGTVGTTSSVINIGQQTSNTAAVQLSSTSTVPTNGIIVEALSTNGASVFIGGSAVTTSTGFELQPGQSMPLTCNLNTIYVIGNNSTDKVCWDVT
jgi:hypothetical protein